MFWTADFLVTNLVWQSMFISWSVLWKGCFAVFKVTVIVKVKNFSECLPGQYLWSIWSIRLSMVMHHPPGYHTEIFCYVQGQSHNCFSKSSEILKLLQPKLIWWYIITRQGKTLWKDFLAFTQVWGRKYSLGDCGLDCCHSWPSQYLKQGSIPVPIKKMWKEHCFCNEYTCLLSFLVNGSSMSFLYPFVLMMMST